MPKHNDGFNDDYLRHDEALALADEINARPGWKAEEPQPDYGPLWRVDVAYTPLGYLTFWTRHSIQSRRSWEGFRDREERMAKERMAATMNCNMAVEYWEEPSESIPEGRWITFAYVSMRYIGAMIGQWLHTTGLHNHGTPVRVTLIHGLGAFGDLMDRWPNKIDCDTDIAPCKHTNS